MFGSKKRSRKRVEEYKESYRKLTPAGRQQHYNFLALCAAMSTFRNQAVVEMARAAAEVEREEAKQP